MGGQGGRGRLENVMRTSEKASVSNGILALLTNDTNDASMTSIPHN